MFYKLCCAVSEMKTAKEAAEFLRDIISYPEAEMIAKRFKIAEMLDEGRESDSNIKEYGLASIKKRFPLYYWPEIVLENVVANMNSRQKQKIKGVLNEMGKMKEKSDLYRRLKGYGF